MRKLFDKSVNAGWPAILLFAFLAVLTITSCQDDGDGSGAPVIHHVRMTDPALADSTFTDAYPGTMIAIIGENLGGVKEVYINGYEISFNPTYSTSTSLILLIPTVDPENPDQFQLVGTNPDLPSEIRVVTDHGTAAFAFHVLSPAPYITRLAVNYPVDPGEELTIVGGNFYEVQKVYFSEDSVNVSQEVGGYTVNADCDEITFPAPSTVIEKGYLFVVCYTDTASVAFIRNAPEPEVTGISSIMPVVGSEVTITGQNFINVTQIDVNGEFVIAGEDIEVSETFDELTFILPQAPACSGTLSVSTVGGTAELPGKFYPTENVVLDYDGIGSFSWGGDNAPSGMPSVATPALPPYVSTGNMIGVKATVTTSNQWWFGPIVNNAQWVSTGIIPGSTPISDLEFQFECYIAQEYEGPVMQITLGCDNNAAYTLKDYVPVSSFTGEMEVGNWMQVGIPMNSIVDSATWQDFLNQGNSTLGIYLSWPTCSGEEYVEFYVDNFRVVPLAE